MKKRILSVAIVTAVAVAAGWNFNQSKNEVELSDLALANVEALASGEDGTGVCYNTITSKEGARVRYCPTCSWEDGTDPWYAISSKC